MFKRWWDKEEVMTFEQEKAAEDSKEKFDPDIDPELLGQSVDKLDGEDDDDGNSDND
jgi:hypothetical protein